MGNRGGTKMYCPECKECVAVDKDIKEVPTRLIGDVEPEHFVKDL